MSTDNQTCKERIGENYRSAIHEIKVALGWIKPKKSDFDWFGIDPSGLQEDDIKEAIYTAYLEDILSLGDFDNRRGAPIPRWFDKNGYDERYEYDSFPHRIINLELSWGGPSDGFVIYADGNTIHDIYYYFQDWFDGAILKVTGNNFEAVKAMVEDFIYKDEFRSIGRLTHR